MEDDAAGFVDVSVQFRQHVRRQISARQAAKAPSRHMAVV
jgi:hypothetical protein